MTVQSEISRNDYIGNGATATYSYGFRIFAATDLLVTQVTAAGVETTLVYPTNYSVTGVGSFSGGTITLTAGVLASGYGLTIRFKSTLTQGTDIRNQGGFFPEVIEDAVDRLTRIDQQQQDELNRSIRLPETEAGSALARTLPTLATRASKYLAFDASGNPIASAAQSGTPTSAFMTTMLDDANAAAALTTLGVSSFIQTVLDDTTSNDALTTITATRSEAGATAVPALTKLRERMSVFDFLTAAQIAEVIARAGTSDLATPIAAAIAAAGAAGKTLYFPGGIYDVGSMLTITTSSTVLVADGDVTLRRRAAAVIASVLRVGFDTATSISSPMLRGFTFDGNGGCTDAVLKIKNVTFGSFHNLTITGGAAIGLRTDTSTDNVNTKQVRNEYFNIRSHSNATIGMLFQGEKDSRYLDLFAHNNTTDGIYFKAFKFDGNTLSETTQCAFSVLISRDNGGSGFVIDGVEKYTGSAMLSAGNLGPGVKFLSTLFGTAGTAGNSLTVASFTSRNDGGGIRMADSALVNSANFANVLLIGFSSALNADGIVLHGVSNIYFGTVRVVGFHGEGVYMQSGTPLGVATECSNIHFGTLHLDSNGDAAAASNHGIQIGNSSASITIGTLISGNSQTTGTNYELQITSTVGPVYIGYAQLSPNAAANAMNVGTASLHFGKLRISGGAVVSPIADGVTAPAANVVGQALIYVDAADGDLKVRFSDGVIKTIVIDT